MANDLKVRRNRKRIVTRRKRVLSLVADNPQLFGGFRHEGALIDHLLKAEVGSAAPSGQAASPGLKGHPFNFKGVTEFKNANPHHSTCIETKASSTVGLGFEDKTVTKLLNPLCELSCQDMLNGLGEDFWQTGNAVLEVVRRRKDHRIVGLHKMQSPYARIVVEDNGRQWHWLVSSPDLVAEVAWPRFGDGPSFMKRVGSLPTLAGVAAAREGLSV